jgi:branched-chain amino acid transport system substrate-binding protein
MQTECRKLSAALCLLTLVATGPARAQKQYDPGASDTEIRIGNIMPYSGPVSAYRTLGQAEAAFFRMINDQGGINGRKVNFISYDDAYSPPKAVEQARKLVESDEVLLIFQAFGTASNTAIQKYMNAKKVPQLFIQSGAAKWGDPARFPWTMGFQPNYQTEGAIYAKYILDNAPSGKIAVLYQNDDFGRDIFKGLKDGLGQRASMIVATSAYETTEPSIDSRIVELKSSGADVFVDISVSKFAAHAIKRAAELGWKPLHLIANVSTSIPSILAPAGLENAKGLLSSAFQKDATDPQLADDPGHKSWVAFMEKYFPEGNREDNINVTAWIAGKALVQVLQQCGDNLTRDNVMKQAASLRDFEVDMLIPGIRINTSPTDYFPIESFQMRRFDGQRWVPFGPIITHELRQPAAQD